MSASSKKKLRKEQQAAQLTEKQLKQQSEDKKLKVYSVTFIVIILVIALAALAIVGVTTVRRHGLIEKSTVAATIDGKNFSAVEMNYYFVDAVSNTYNQWQSTYGENTSSYTAAMGLNLAAPLDEQVYNEQTGETWADYFFGLALNQARSDYAMSKQAAAVGFTLSEEDQAALESTLSQVDLYASVYGYNGTDGFLRATYGNGADQKSYREYCERSALASTYYNDYYNSLTYDDGAIRAKDAENPKQYNAYSYAYYYVSYAQYLEGGTEAEDGTITYTEQELNAARAKAKEVAQHLAEFDSVEALDAAIAALPINAANENTSTLKVVDGMYSGISATAKDWISDESRKENDVTYLEYASTTTDEDGNETSSVNGYYVVIFQGVNENLRKLANVRHLLVNYESATGETTYTDEEKAAAYAEAEQILNEWKAGDATEESFAALVTEKTDDTGSAETGGLYMDITPQQGIYVENFTNWSVDPDRKSGDVEIIETEYGCHIMYYVGDSDITYRDYMIATDLRNADTEAWYNDLFESVSATKGSLKRTVTSLVMDVNAAAN